jgi:hypothetical protein
MDVVLGRCSGGDAQKCFNILQQGLCEKLSRYLETYKWHLISIEKASPIDETGGPDGKS